MKALIIGHSGGLGQALGAHYRDLGYQVTGLSRSADGFEIGEEASIAAHIRRVGWDFDRVMLATGVLNGAGRPPEKSLSALSVAAMADQFAINAMGPALVLKYLIAQIPRDRAVKIGVLSARVGSIGDNALGGWYAYRAAKAALNQLVHTTAIEWVRRCPQSVLALLHPGTVQTEFSAAYHANHPTISPAESASQLIATLEVLSPLQTGQFYDFNGVCVPW